METSEVRWKSWAKASYEMLKCWVRKFGFKAKKRSLDFILK